MKHSALERTDANVKIKVCAHAVLMKALNSVSFFFWWRTVTVDWPTDLSFCVIVWKQFHGSYGD